MIPRSRRKVAFYVTMSIFLVGAIAGSANFIQSQQFLNQTSSAAGGQQGSQNQAAQSSIAIESGTFALGVFPSITLVVRNVGATTVTLESVTVQGSPSNAGFRSSLTDAPTPSCSPSSILPKGASCTYGSTSPYLRSLEAGDVVSVKVTTTVGTFASAQFTVQPGATAPTGAANPFGGQAGPSFRANQVEFFADLTLRVVSPDAALSRVESVAYSNGGYVASSTMTNASAYAVVRVPGASYETALAAIRSIGNVTSYSTTSNDVTLQVINLNATLQSYLAEKAALLRLQDKSGSLGDTVQIFSQLQSIDAQIDTIQAQILNTNRLVAYSTIAASMVLSRPAQPLTMKLTTTPRAGTSPLIVTFSATVGGGTAPYSVSYYFGDGATDTSQRLLTHTFTQSGDYNVTVVAMDSTGGIVERWVLVRVGGPSTGQDFARFAGFATGLFIGVVEGIIEVAAVAVPIILILALVVVPLGQKYLLPKVRQKQPSAQG